MPFRSKKLLASAKDQPCCACNAYGSTVSAHLNSVAMGKGVGIKSPDCFVAWLCRDCHDLYDGRRGCMTRDNREAFWMRAFLRTVNHWFTKGIVVVK